MFDFFRFLRNRRAARVQLGHHVPIAPSPTSVIKPNGSPPSIALSNLFSPVDKNDRKVCDVLSNCDTCGGVRSDRVSLRCYALKQALVMHLMQAAAVSPMSELLAIGLQTTRPGSPLLRGRSSPMPPSTLGFHKQALGSRC